MQVVDRLCKKFIFDHYRPHFDEFCERLNKTSIQHATYPRLYLTTVNIIRSVYPRNQLKMKISVLALFLAVLVAIASAGGNGYYGGSFNSRGYGKIRSYNAHTKWDSSNRWYAPSEKNDVTDIEDCTLSELMHKHTVFIVHAIPIHCSPMEFLQK